MSAAVIASGSGAWITVGIASVIVVVSFLGCWFGAPPDTRRTIVRGVCRDVRRELAIRQWKREQRSVRATR